jgi:long-chain fatty acid transport protein
MTTINGASPVRRFLAATLITALCITAAPGPVVAAGFYLAELGSPRSSGTAGVANVTNNTGPDAVWSNPAGLTGMARPAILTGATLIAPTAKWDSDVAEAGGIDGGNAGQPAIVPGLFYAQPLSEKWFFGFGLSASQGGGADYGNNFVGRYGATRVLLQGVGATWSFGYQATDKLSLGFGGTVIYTQFEQKIAINQSAVIPGAPDAEVEFKDLDDLGIQPIVGLQYEFTDGLLFGLTYRAEFDAELEGNLRFRNLAPGVPLPANSKLEIDWENPQWLEAGIAAKVTSDKFLFLNANWQDWSEFSSNQLTVSLPDPGAPPVSATLDRNFDDTWSVGVAFGTRQRDIYPGANLPNRGWVVGLAYESSPVDDKDRTIDLPFDESWKLSAAYFRQRKDRFNWSLAGSLQLFGDNEVDQTIQGGRFAGDFKDFYVVYLTGTIRWLN